MSTILSSRQRIAPCLIRRSMTSYRWYTLGAPVVLLFTAMITLSLGQGIRLLVDQESLTTSPELPNRYTLLFFALVLGLVVGTFVRFYPVFWIGEHLAADICKRVFDHLIKLHPSSHETNHSSETQSYLAADTTLLQTAIDSLLLVTLHSALTLAGGVLLMSVTDVKLTSIVVLALLLVITSILLLGRHVYNLPRESQNRVAGVGSYIGETLSQIKTVQAYNHQTQDRQHFASITECAFDTVCRRTAQYAWLITAVIVLMLDAVGIMFWVGGRDIVVGSVLADKPAAFVSYSLIVGTAFDTLNEVIGGLQYAVGTVERIAKLFRARNKIRLPMQPRKLAVRMSGKVELQVVCFVCPICPEHRATDDISLAVEPGETLALVGPSGAGESALFGLPLRFLDPWQGWLLLDGQPTIELNPADLRRSFALVSRNPALLFSGAEENICYGCPHTNVAEAEAVAHAIHVHELILSLPQGYATHLGEDGTGLSGSQRQRLATARVLLVDAPTLLLNEATSALDAENEHLVQQALSGLMGGRTTLVVTHYLAVVQSADHIAVIDQG